MIHFQQNVIQQKKANVELREANDAISFKLKELKSSKKELKEKHDKLERTHNELMWGYGPQGMGRTIEGGPAHKIKACTALLGVLHETLYSTKQDSLLVTLPFQTI